jgi:hypothetical protein
MSWKSLVSAGLLCVLASPVLAAPSLTVVPGGTVANNRLNANGNWVWRVQVAPSNPLDDPTGTPLATELGFRETSSAELLGAVIANSTVWDTANPGGSDAQQQEIFPDWETSEDVDPGAGTNLRPVGLKFNLPTDEVASYYGSSNVTTTAPTNYIDIEVQGPSSTRLTTSIQWLGAYGGNGRIAELDVVGAGGDCPQDACNFDTYAGTVSFTAKLGDADLNNSVDIGDLNIWLTSTGTGWHQGDFDDNNSVDIGDLNIWLTSPGGAGSGSGAGLVAGGGVPEPSTVALVALALVGIGSRFRRR